MGRLRPGVPAWLVLPLWLAGCGGGGASSFVQPPPPPVADFSISIPSGPLTVNQGASSQPVVVTVNSLNGFSGTVQISLSGLPSGVTSNPVSPFGVAAGSSASVIFGAAASATTGNFTVMAQGSSGALSHSGSLSLTIQPAAAAALPRTTFVRTDSIAAADNSAGEPHHRHAVYDAARKQVFAANRAMNRVEVFSSIDLTRKAQLAVPAASSADLSADGATLWIGTVTNDAVAIDPQSLQIRARYTIPALAPVPNSAFDRPEELLAMANGNLMVRLRQASQSEALLALWNPISNSMVNLTSAEPQLFQNGLGAMARSGDHSRLVVAASDSSGELAVFDANGNAVSGPRGLGNGSIPLVAANADGSRIAVVLAANGGSQLFLLDGALNSVAGPLSSQVASMVFARDGSSLSVTQKLPGSGAITILDGRDLHVLGQVPDAAVEGNPSELEDADETGALFGLGNRGVVLVDASKPINLAGAAPIFSAAPMMQPSEGPSAGGTVTTVTGQNFSALTELNFGTQVATNPSVIGNTQIQVSSPPNVASGPSNVTAYFSNGWLALAPDAFSYGPQILQVLPNTAAKGGGDTIQIYGYGFGSDASKVTVKIAGASATVQKLDSAAALGLASDYPFSLERVTLTVPAGGAGKADVVVSTPTGSATGTRALQYLQSVQSFAKPGFYRFILYDQKRQRLYLTNIEHLDVFDLASQQFLGTIQPPGGPSLTSGLRGLSLTPDASQLIVADFGAQSVYLMDPDTRTGSAIAVGGVAGFANSGPARVAATSTQTVFVGLSGEGGTTGGCSACLAQMNLAVSPPAIQPAPQPEVTAITGTPLVQGNAAGDHVFVVFGTAPGGPVASWSATVPNQFATANANSSAIDLGVSADGTSFATQNNATTEIRASDLSLAAVPALAEITQIPGRVIAPGLAMHPSGALLYQPFLTGAPGAAATRGGVDIFDARSGVLRLRVFLPEQLLTDVDALHGSFLAVDETGARLFALTSSDGTAQNAAVTVVQLANVPLAIGTISPNAGSTAGGTALTIRGSGFQAGASAKLGGKPAAVVFKDGSTLTITTPALAGGPQQIIITNPDGESVQVDAAFVAN
jgi:hypothetical protein